MNKKIPQKHEPKKSAITHAPVLLKLNKKQSYIIRPLAPTCRLPERSRVWERRGRYVVYVIHDGQIKYLEFGSTIFKCFQASPKTDDDPYFNDYPVLRDTRPFDPGDSIHGGEWRIYYSKPHRSWKAEFLKKSRLSKHHRKLVHTFLKEDANPFDSFTVDNNAVRPVFKYTEKIIPI